MRGAGEERTLLFGATNGAIAFGARAPADKVTRIDRNFLRCEGGSKDCTGKAPSSPAPLTMQLFVRTGARTVTLDVSANSSVAEVAGGLAARLGMRRMVWVVNLALLKALKPIFKSCQ